MLGLPTITFSQSLLDNIDFNSVNKDLINNELIRMIIDYRDIIGSTPIVKDTAPMFSAKYHMMYFETYGDESVIHDKPIVYDLYGLGYSITSIYDSPANRLFTLGLQATKGGEYHLVTEISKFYKIDVNKKITYFSFIKMIYDDMIIDKSIINDNSDIKKYLGVSNGIHRDEFGEIKFGITLVIGKKI